MRLDTIKTTAVYLYAYRANASARVLSVDTYQVFRIMSLYISSTTTVVPGIIHSFVWPLSLRHATSDMARPTLRTDGGTEKALQ